MTGKSKLKFIFCAFAFLQIVLAQTAAKPADILAVVDFTYSPQDGRVTFSVINNSARPVLAYVLKLTCSYADGSTLSIDLRRDYVGTLAFVGKVLYAPPGSNVGELLRGARSGWSFTVPDKKQDHPINVTVDVDAVVFSDNSVIGDNEAAINRLFDVRKASAEEYAVFLAALQNTRSSPDTVGALNKLADRVKQAKDGKDVAPWHSSAYQLFPCFECAQFEASVKGVLRVISSKKASVEQALSKYTELAQAHYSAYLNHAKRAPGGQQ
jgi:hypothetical protein